MHYNDRGVCKNGGVGAQPIILRRQDLKKSFLRDYRVGITAVKVGRSVNSWGI